MARELQAGTVWINDWAEVYDEFEEGGYRQSGLDRLNGAAALDDFIEYKHITMSTGAPINGRIVRDKRAHLERATTVVRTIRRAQPDCCRAPCAPPPASPRTSRAIPGAAGSRPARFCAL
ncbi:hypothetical protein WL80_05655 [Burkholderia ubonensis]|uniref:Aldehyde dehydrogenase domain-containing protein n=1 Tax=Burkholderia ubonensis TaxID=101571 RepID=A0ABD6Q1H4_9BURK|nr:hypothetical protein WJ60_08845 [Burkholderia ubonensis]KVT48424.1 hypothetical protein WK51_31235 [Burkholderia ubonensis]KVX94622.1 hypothetical protein WL08_24160 [Burkholderia ubonensis]KWE96278.1 hypothetical protein WL80_05655 [Burkholderia ubonensis]OJA45471.1 hypothetical protein BGV66_18840 [Burkholderia ubonensis]